MCAYLPSFRLKHGRISSYLQGSQFFTRYVLLCANGWPRRERQWRKREGPRFSSSLPTQNAARPPCSPVTPGGPASWCVLHQRPAIHFPRLWFMDCCVGVGTRVYVCVWLHQALLPLELVHCPASSCFATQWAGAANLHRQTVTYSASRLLDEDGWLSWGIVYTNWFSLEPSALD